MSPAERERRASLTPAQRAAEDVKYWTECEAIRLAIKQGAKR